jgi:hypothetical protein
MKIRLEGTKAEIDWAVESLKEHYSLPTISKLYPNRDRITYRCYVELFPSTHGEARRPAPGDAVLGGGSAAGE